MVAAPTSRTSERLLPRGPRSASRAMIGGRSTWPWPRTQWRRPSSPPGVRPRLPGSASTIMSLIWVAMVYGASASGAADALEHGGQLVAAVVGVVLNGDLDAGALGDRREALECRRELVELLVEWRLLEPAPAVGGGGGADDGHTQRVAGALDELGELF